MTARPCNGRAKTGNPFIDGHNDKRCLHKDTPIAALDTRLTRETEQFANGCPTGHASRSARNNAGENLYWTSGKATAEASVDAWYSEVDNCKVL